MSIGELFFRVYNRILARHSNSVFGAILRTPPFTTDPDAETILYSVLDGSNCCAYLLAVKSLLRYLGEAVPLRVVIQSDGSLGEESIRHLRSHIRGVEICGRDESQSVIEERASPDLLRLLPPWDRCHFFLVHKLLNVLYRFPGKKVILYDSDLLFLRQPPFLVDWIKDGRDTCFHSDGGNSLTPVFRGLGFDFSNVDINTFNAGLVGFHNQVEEPFLIEVMARIRAHDPGLFANWEIEQAIWAVLFNRMPNPVNLDHVEKDYVASGYWPLERIRQSVVAHFIGSVRFKNLRYPRLARPVIRELSRRQTPSGELAATWSTS